MHLTGCLRSSDGISLDGYFGATDAKGTILFGPSPTDPGGLFEMGGLVPGNFIFFGANGYVDQTVKVIDTSDKVNFVVYLKKQNYLLPIGLMVIGAWLFYKNSKGKKYKSWL